MSLVNDMLRDLETRRAAPTERLQLAGLQAVDEAGAARRERSGLLRRGLLWLVALGLVGLLLGALILGWPRLPMLMPSAAQIPVPVSTPVPAAMPAQVLEVLPQHDGRGLVLQLLLERSVAYMRSEENGSVSLRLPGMGLSGGPQQGRLQRDGRTLSWRVEAQGPDVQVLVLGLGDGLEVRDRLEPAGNRWLLWIEVPLTESAAEVALDLDALPLAEPATVEAEPPLPAWASAPVPVLEAALVAPAISQVEAPSGPPEVKVVPHQPDALAQALEFLQAGDYPQAIRALEALHQARAQDPEVLHWLARAYLAGGEQQRLLSWLPGQVRQWPHDSELRLLLARAQLQAADSKGAVATLERNPPALGQEPNYHALLAASYQQTSQWRESVALYRQLVELRPNQPTWQLGLAIGLEQLDQGAEAGRHYRLALQGQGLDDGSRRFASERSSALGVHR